jgi:hypothetical protein
MEAAMRVLMIESSQGLGGQVADRLEARGHEVVTCFETTASVPCRGVDDAAACPLEGQGVDAAVVVRDPTLARPSLHEMGAVCALRHRVPLVEADSAGDSPYAGYARRADWDLTRSVEEAAKAQREEHAAAVHRTIMGLPAFAAVAPDDVGVTVERDMGRVRVALQLPADLPSAAIDSAITWATRSARQYDPFSQVLDVALSRS